MANRNQTYDPLMSTTGGMSEMDPEQTKGVMQDILRQKIAESLDKYSRPAGLPAESALPEYPYQTQTNFMLGYDRHKDEEFMENPMASADPESALAFARMQNAWKSYNQDVRGHPQPLYLTQSNRTIEEQLKAHGKKDTPENREWARGMTHVLGKGFDINQFNVGTGLKDYRGARHKWMRENAAKFGFHWPGYTDIKGRGKTPNKEYKPIRPGFSPVPGKPWLQKRPEWWHWNYDPAKAAGGHAAIPEYSKIPQPPPVAATTGATTSVGT